MLVVFIAGTGLLLNHSAELELDQVLLDSDWILGLYGIEVETDPIAFTVGQTWLSRYGSRLYVNDQDTGLNIEQLIGAIELDDLLLVAVPDSLLLMTSSGELVEKIEVLPGISGTHQAIGKIGDIPVLETMDGLYAGDMELSAWRRILDGEPVWAVPERLPERVLRQIELKHRGEGINLERFVLDIHSGAVLGKLGKYLSDLFAILILLLSLSGLWVSRLRRRMNLTTQSGIYNDR